MDIISHGLWATAGSKLVNKKTKIRVNLWRAFFWGVFPDLFSLGPTFLYVAITALASHQNLFDGFWHNQFEPPTPFAQDLFSITPLLYSATHSIFFFAAMVGISYFVRKFFIPRLERGSPRWAARLIKSKRIAPGQISVIPWEMGGWLLHILFDIPTHSYAFYATPFLWPFSQFRFDGYSWTHAWFTPLNYLAILIVFLIIRFVGKKKLTK